MKIILTSILAFFGFGCGNDNESKTELVNANELQKGPIQRESLSDKQIKRIDKLREILADVDTQTKEQWIDNFKRDLNPDREIAIFEKMAEVYQKYCEDKNLSKETKKEVFEVILLRSMAMKKEDVLSNTRLKNLSKEEAEKIIEMY